MINNENHHLNIGNKEYSSLLNSVYSQIAGHEISNAINSTFNQEIWISELIDDKIGKVYHPSYPLNNALPNSICSNFGKYDTYIVLNEFSREGGLKEGFSTTKYNGGDFLFPSPIVVQGFDKSQSSVNLTMSIDSQYIFIAMDDKNLASNSDIYISKRIDTWTYSSPKRIKGVNSEYKENTPFLTLNGDRLYFASNRPGYIGGFDIFYAERLDDTYENWGEPMHILPPINTKDNETYPFIASDEDIMYFTSNRDGSMDIFKANIERKENLDEQFKVFVTVVSHEGKPMPAEINWEPAYKKDGKSDFFRSRDGSYTILLDKSTPMVFWAENRSKKSQREIIDPFEIEFSGKNSINLTLTLSPGGTIIKIEKKELQVIDKPQNEYDLYPFTLNQDSIILLKNIYFEKAKPTVLSASYEELRKLASILKRKDKLRIRVEGHTDNVGNKNSLIELSSLRAEEIKKFLISEGVFENRITTKGYGDTRPISENRNEKEKQRNRRVEIRLLNKEL
jgi:outer membrane protein OmpA-like peptidoglycan-associated protein